MTDLPPNSPVARAPAPLRAAHAAAEAAFNANPTQANWALLSAAVLACIDHDDRQRNRPAA